MRDVSLISHFFHARSFPFHRPWIGLGQRNKMIEKEEEKEKPSVQSTFLKKLISIKDGALIRRFEIVSFLQNIIRNDREWRFINHGKSEKSDFHRRRRKIAIHPGNRVATLIVGATFVAKFERLSRRQDR